MAGSDVWSTASGSTIRRGGVASSGGFSRGGPLAGTSAADFDDDLVDDVSRFIPFTFFKNCLDIEQSAAVFELNFPVLSFKLILLKCRSLCREFVF